MDWSSGRGTRSCASCEAEGIFVSSGHVWPFPSPRQAAGQRTSERGRNNGRLPGSCYRRGNQRQLTTALVPVKLRSGIEENSTGPPSSPSDQRHELQEGHLCLWMDADLFLEGFHLAVVHEEDEAVALEGVQGGLALFVPVELARRGQAVAGSVALGIPGLDQPLEMAALRRVVPLDLLEDTRPDQLPGGDGGLRNVQSEGLPALPGRDLVTDGKGGGQAAPPVRLF